MYYCGDMKIRTFDLFPKSIDLSSVHPKRQSDGCRKPMAIPFIRGRTGPERASFPADFQDRQTHRADREAVAVLAGIVDSYVVHKVSSRCY